MSSASSASSTCSNNNCTLGHVTWLDHKIQDEYKLVLIATCDDCDDLFYDIVQGTTVGRLISKQRLMSAVAGDLQIIT